MMKPLRKLMIPLFRWMAVITLVVGAFLYAESKNHAICSPPQNVRFCDESLCGPYPACFGGCECELFTWRECVTVSHRASCNPTPVPVAVTVLPGSCDAGSRSCICDTSGATPIVRWIVKMQC